MKISELIKQLEHIKSGNGDLDMLACSLFDMTEPYEVVAWRRPENNQLYCVVMTALRYINPGDGNVN